MIYCYVLCLFLLVQTDLVSASTSYSFEDKDGDAIIDFVDGDILLGYIADGSLKDRKNRVQNILSFQAAVTNSTYWPQNAAVGYVVVNFQTYPKESYIDRLIQVLHKHPKIVALFGFMDPDYVLHSASFVSAIKIPSFTVASSIQIDDLLKVDNNEFMTRITSTRSRQLTDTIPSILSGLGINIVSIFYEKERESEFTKLIQVLDLGDNKVDVEYHQRLNGSVDSISSHVAGYILKERHFEEDSVAEQERLHTIVLLLRGSTFDKLIKSLKNVKGISDVIFITDSSGCRLRNDITETIQDIIKDRNFIFRLCQTEYSASEVMSYMENYKLYERQNGENELSVSSKVLDRWYKQQVGDACIVGVDEGCQSVGEISLKGTTSRYNHRIYYGVRKVLKSLDNISNEEVEQIEGRTFDDVMINTSLVGDMARSKFLENNVPLPEDTTFLRYTDGLMEDDFEVIFDYNVEGISRRNVTVWTSGVENSKFENFMRDAKSEIAELSDGKQFVCSSACTAGYKKVLDKRFLNCWTCVPCRGNRYTQYGNWSTCQECDSKNTFLWVNENKTACDKEAGSLNFSTMSGTIVWIIASFNILVLIFTVAIYIKNWKSRVIISSGRDLSCVMFCGILLGHIEAMLIAMEPTSNLCIYVQILSHLIIMLTVCPLLVKTFRIWMVFKFSIKLGRRLRNYVNDWVTMSECLVLMLPLLALLLAGLFLDDSKSYKFTVNYEEESLESPVIVTKSCGPLNFTLMLIGIVYAGLLLLVSSVLGWGCRKLPDNFKESMHIFLSSLISLLLIAVYVPAMLTMAGFTQVSLLAGVITIICLTLNLVIFLPKVYVVLFVPPIRQRAMFKSGKMGDSSRKSVVSETVIHDVSE